MEQDRRTRTLWRTGIVCAAKVIVTGSNPHDDPEFAASNRMAIWFRYWDRMMRGRLVQFAWMLCVASGACLTAVYLLWWLDGGTAHDGRKFLTFVKPSVVKMVSGLAPAVTMLLFVLAVFAQVKKVENRASVAMALLVSVGWYGVAVMIVVFTLFAKSCSWYVETHLKGTDNRTYYILHAPPPLNGPGHSALARRTGGNPFYYTMQILSNEDYESTFGRQVLVAALKDTNPEARRSARMLLSTFERVAAKQRN